VLVCIPDRSQPKTESGTDQSAVLPQQLLHSAGHRGVVRVKTLQKVMPAAARAQWLSELAKAIDEAQWLAWRIGVVEGRNAQALELYVQLELVRAEVEALRGRKFDHLRHAPSSAFPAAVPTAPASDPLCDFAATREGLEE
jgi:hypothetical protein